MAVYKVPQDVEAEDKLIGPFSFRQFIYLIVAALGMLLAWGLGRLFIGLIVIPLPIIVTFLVLALPLRKDQPMETYITAVIRFYLKPRQRLWMPEGTISLVQITAPNTVEYRLTKDFSGAQASQQLSYLAQVVDTQGWATRGVITTNQGMTDTVVAEAQATEDMLDNNTNIARSFGQRISQSDESRKQAMLQQFQQAAKEPPAAPAPSVAQPSATTRPVDPADLSYDPYPNMHQRVLSPSGTLSNRPQTPATSRPVEKPVEKPSPQTVSPDIIRLANNNDLSISTLAKEAHRLENDGQEVEISLR